MDQLLKFLNSAEIGVDEGEVRNIVSHHREVEMDTWGRSQMQMSAKLLEVVQLHRHAAEIALAITIRVVKRTNRCFVERRILEPEGRCSSIAIAAALLPLVSLRITRGIRVRAASRFRQRHFSAACFDVINRAHRLIE